MNSLKLICVSFALVSTIMQTTPQKMERITEYLGCTGFDQVWVKVRTYIRIEGSTTHFEEHEETILTREKPTAPLPENELPPAEDLH